jgi:hypothetical protein
MPSLRPHAAYLLGFTPQLLGIFFNGVLILERTRSAAQGRLADRITWYLEDWVPSRGPDVVQNVHLCESLLREAGREIGEPPQSVEAFYEWSERVNRETYQVAKASFDAAASAHEKEALFRVRLAQDVGQQVGDVVHTANLAGLVQALLHEAPDHEALTQQAIHFGEAQKQIVLQLEKVLTYTLGYDDIQDEVRRILAIVRRAPDAGTITDHATAAVKLGELPGELDVARVEKLFMSAS